jgi:hypothetical protein
MRKAFIHTYTWQQGTREHKAGDTSRLVIADTLTNEAAEAEARTIATLPITLAHPIDEQEALANAIVKFLNARTAAMEKAVEDDALLQRIMQ